MSEIRNAIMQMASQDPSLNQGLDAIERSMGPNAMVPEDLDEAIELLEFVLQHPESYEQAIAAAVADGLIDEGMLPAQYDASLIVSLLISMYGMQDRTAQKMARGGLTFAARQAMTGGRGGDSELVHVNRRESEMLQRMGGAGTINPNTGLREYKFSFKKFLAAALPIAVAIFAPQLAPFIGEAMGLSGTAASIAGGAVVGGASSALAGGDWKKGALMGGLGGGLGSYVGEGVSNALNLNLGSTGQAVLGSGLVGGVSGLATGQGFLKGAAQGVLGGAIGELAGNVSGGNALGEGLKTAGQTAGRALTAGYDPKTAATVGGLAGLATGMTYKPSDTVVKNLQAQDVPEGTIPGEQSAIRLPGGATTTNVPGTTGTNALGQSGTYQLNPKTGAIELKVGPGQYTFNPETNAVEWKAAEPSFWDKVTAGGPLDKSTAGATTAGADKGSPLGTLGKVAMMGTALSALSSAPPQVQQAVSSLSPEQQEYFNRPSIAWDWNRLQQDANANNLSLSQYMARNWNAISSGQYNMQPAAQPGMARGGYHMMPDGSMMRNDAMMANGGLGVLARFARGAGTGRSDEINARLSDGEYVFDAESVAMLGDGSSDAGARKLDAMRAEIRKHKGKALAKGKFSPDAKSPLAYLKGVA